jgi:tRNA(Arg) A34 adenosine deaminase TadA
MNKYLTRAVELSNESFEKGRFPAGAVLVKDDEIIGEGISGLYPHIHIHAETQLIDDAMAKYNAQLKGYELYTSMEPCMMCLGKAYWSGIRKITYVLAKEDVDQELAYENKLPTETIKQSLNSGIQLEQDATLHKAALDIYKTWETKIKKLQKGHQ